MRDAAAMPVIGVRLAEGRSGSTLVMQLLATSDHIVFDDRYPAEYRWLSYFARMAGRMTEPFDEAIHPGVTEFFFGREHRPGPVPFESDVVDVSAMTAPLLRGMWNAWSSEMQRRHPDARFYAEKLAIDVGTLRAAAIPVRIIDLVRDPRDVLASVRTFTSRGVDGFGRRPGQSERDDLDRFVTTYATAIRSMHAAPEGVERQVVRYEDLVADLTAVGDRLAGWLGTELDVSAVDRQRSRYRHHMTSPSAEESVGRWRRDLRPEESDLIASRLGALMQPFGYDL